MIYHYKSLSALQTKTIARTLAQEVIKFINKFNQALIIGLSGDLGSGKTVFAQGFGNGLGLKHKITSPTFLLVRKYKLNKKNFDYFYHLDMYRIKNLNELKTIDFQKIISNPKNIVLIEWADVVKKNLPSDIIWVQLKHTTKNNQRIITIYIK
ncbi:MAG: tRNA (adenosine(37)-N6)-threonylcarbamoyltransferase complex ATPase subunit type 1 TsaE [Minisyncoccia bacterium]